MTYEDAVALINEHVDYGGSLDRHELAIAIAADRAAAPTRTTGADDARPVAIQDLYEVAPVVDKWMRDKAVALAGDQYADLVDLAATVVIATRDGAPRAQAPDSAA